MSIIEELGAALNARRVGDLAGSAVFERGVGYWEDRRVESVVEEDGRLLATVRGTLPYHVELWFEDDALRWACSCPAAEDGSFCKHCTAVALSLLYADDPTDRVIPPAAGPEAAQSADSGDDLLAEFVHRLDAERLAEIVLSQSAADWALRERLLLEARAEQGLGPDMAQWRARIDDAFSFGEMDCRGYAHYRGVEDWLDCVSPVIDALGDLAAAGRHEAAAELAEHAYQRTDLAMGELYDEDGSLIMIAEQLADLHYQACEQGAPNPVKLARRLAKLELNYELEAFCRSAVLYEKLLGPVGLAAFREAVEPAWLNVDPSDSRWRARDCRAREAMVGWALAIGDPDALVEAHRRERIGAGGTLEIARAYEAAGRDDEAVSWARQGLSDIGHGSWQADELRDFLARKLREQGDAGAAIDLYWKAFTASPSLTACRTLMQQDDRPDSPDWLERCLRHLRRLLSPDASKAAPPPQALTDVMVATADRAPAAAVVLAEILLYEDRVDEAWEAAMQHGSSRQMWMSLARAREATAPRDSIAVYKSAALAVIDRKISKNYCIAVDHIARIRRLAAEAGEPELFDALLHHVRTAHKAKRRLQSELKDMTPLVDAPVERCSSDRRVRP
ncbi:MAG: SWIM zinc finger family protein [Acidimicrobiaceae bacterium]|nr:SWIM zinc finger family protein [Acidimicrobiaceae bacterium]